jgi:hypothetical protein
VTAAAGFGRAIEVIQTPVYPGLSAKVAGSFLVTGARIALVHYPKDLLDAFALRRRHAVILSAALHTVGSAARLVLFQINPKDEGSAAPDAPPAADGVAVLYVLVEGRYAGMCCVTDNTLENGLWSLLDAAVGRH